MKTCLILLSVLATIATAAQTNKYCEKTCKVDGKIIKHIACDHNNKFDRSCPRDAKIVPLTDSLKATIVNAHNEKRNSIAGGTNPKYSSACRMATMQWDDELASLAVLNVKQCKMKHDKCHPTDYFPHSGQNLYYAAYTPPRGINYNKELIKVIENWFSEHKDCKQSIIDNFPAVYSGPKIGHFTVMVADNNIRVGCAAATFIRSENNREFEHIFVACNYAANNMLNSRIYEKCNKAGTSCQTGNNPKYPNLCSAKEVYHLSK